VHRDLPAAEERARDALGTFAEEVGRECVGTLGLAAKLPGPGHYDQDRDAIFSSGYTGVGGSSSFQPGTKRHEWAPEDIGLMPGPGRYDPKKVVPDKLTPATSAFNSASLRNKYETPAAPGPAYYSPPPPKNARSFMMNAKRMWVT
jgi:hypothetical protein